MNLPRTGLYEVLEGLNFSNRTWVHTLKSGFVPSTKSYCRTNSRPLKDQSKDFSGDYLGPCYQKSWCLGLLMKVRIRRFCGVDVLIGCCGVLSNTGVVVTERVSLGRAIYSFTPYR